MGVIAAVRHLMGQSVTVEPFSSQDEYGVPTYGAGVGMAARVVRGRKLVRDTEGREVVSMSRAYVDSAGMTIGAKDRVTLPYGTQPRILHVAESPDSSGDVVVTLFFEG